MIVFVNNKPITLSQSETIPAVLQSLQLAGAKGIAIAVNNAVVPKQEWEKFAMKENDHITIIRATQGG